MAAVGRRAGPGAAAVSPADVERSLAAAGPAPVYLLAGEEAVLRDRVLRALRARLIESGFEVFNYRSLSPSGLDAAALAEEMRVLPMGGGKRLVIVSPADELSKEQIKALSAYAEDPSPAACLVLVAREAKETLRKGFASAVAVDCSSPWEDRIPDYLAAEARELKVRLDREAAQFLAGMCGRDLTRAVGELRKAAGRVGEGGAVTAALLGAIVGGGEAADYFKVTAALARGDAAGAVRSARRLMETEPMAHLRILYDVGSLLRRLLAARALMADGKSARDAAKGVGVFWKDVDAFAGALSRWDEARIAAAYHHLLAADRRVKRGLDEGAGAVEACLWAAFGPGSAPGPAGGPHA